MRGCKWYSWYSCNSATSISDMLSFGRSWSEGMVQDDLLNVKAESNRRYNFEHVSKAFVPSAGRRCMIPEVHVRAVGSLKVSRRPRNMYQTFRYVQYDQPTISPLRRPYILPGCSSGLQFPEHWNKSPTGSAASKAALAYAKRYRQLASRLCKAQLLGRACYGVGTERTTIFVAAGGAEILSLPRN